VAALGFGGGAVRGFEVKVAAQQGATAFIEPGHPTKWAQGHTRARRELGVGPRV
jgi:hypothetical protein